MSNLAVALELAAAGLPVFPALVSHNGATGRWDKKPCVRGWQTTASTDAAQIRAWWQQWPQALPALALGKAGLLVLDTDRHGGPDGVAAFEAIAAGLPPHPVTLTAGNGEHHIFIQPAGKPFGNATGSLPDGVDCRGRGGFIVAPGAIRHDGACWRPKAGAPLLTTAFRLGGVPTLPASLRAMLRPPLPPRGATPTRTGTATAGCAAWLAAALDNIGRDLRNSPRGQRNRVLNGSAYRLARLAHLGLDVDEVRDLLHAASVANGHVADDGDLAFKKTFDAAWAAGRKNPHPGPEDTR